MPGDETTEELPAVERIVSSQPISHPQTLQMLSQFLMDEQERRQSLRESHNLGTTWKDLQNAYETISAFQDPGMAEGGYDTFDGNNNAQNTTMDTGTFGEVQKFALSAAQSIMGSPAELTQAQKEKKVRKERKKKRKEKEKEAKKQAKLQAKMMMGQENRRF